MDELDRLIIEQLQENGRRSNVAIARALGVAETTIRHRIDRLISDGFIRIVAVINPRKTKYQVDVIIWMRLERDISKEAAEAIAQLPNVVYVGHTTGRYDLLVEALFESDEDLFEFLTTKLSGLGIPHSETYHVVRTVKINYDWKLPLNQVSGEALEGRLTRRLASRPRLMTKQRATTGSERITSSRAQDRQPVDSRRAIGKYPETQVHDLGGEKDGP